MERVKESIQKALPSLSSDLIESLMFRLEMIGVNCVDDLSFVKTEDLEGILPPIRCRRVIQVFSAGEQLFKVAVDQVIVNDHIKSPTAALSYTFSMFNVLNIKYPKDMSLTLEFIQRENPARRCVQAVDQLALLWNLETL